MTFGPLVPEFAEKNANFRNKAESTLDSLLGEDNKYYSRTERAEEGVLGVAGLTEYVITDNEGNAVAKVSYDADFNVAVEVKDERYQAKADEIKAKLEEITTKVKGERMKYKGKDIIFQRNGKECGVPWETSIEDGVLRYHANSTGFEAEYSRDKDGNYVVNMKPPKGPAGCAMEQKQACLDDIV